MTNREKIPASDEAWDSGQLGMDEEFVKQVEEDIETQIDEALQLQPISIRLQKSLLDDLKAIGAIRGIGYQPLIRQILWRFADCEKKQILNERLAEANKVREQESQKAKDQDPEGHPKRKRA